MGANTSQISDLSNNQSLKTLVGTESISENDPFWNQLISFTFISPTSRYELVLYSHNGIFLPKKESSGGLKVFIQAVRHAHVTLHRLSVCSES